MSHLHPRSASYPPAWDKRAQKIDCMIYAWDGHDKLLVLHIPCGRLMVISVSTLHPACPRCPTCHRRQWAALCQMSGVTLIGRAEHPDYLLTRNPCGHEAVRRQDLLENYNRRDGPRRCLGCQQERDAEQARVRGWQLLGRDPEHNPRYRLYRHEDCGHIQRIARARMRAGRLTCPRCSPGWRREPSCLYVGRLPLASGMTAVKLGFSRNPRTRLHHLRTKRAQQVQIRHAVAVPTGHEAFIQEKALHALARHTYPEAVLERSAFEGQVTVVSELYHAWLEPVLISWLDEIEKGAQFRRPSPTRPRHHVRRRRRRRLPPSQ